MQIRLDQADHERWKAAAARQGVSLSEFVRVCVDDRITMAEVSGARIVKPPATASTRQTSSVVASVAPSQAKRKAPRATAGYVCPRQRHHRAGVYCRECGTTP